jgi:hypothetical protein
MLLERVDYLLRNFIEILGLIDADGMEEVRLSLLRTAKINTKALRFIHDLQSELVVHVFQQSHSPVKRALFVLRVCLSFAC